MRFCDECGNKLTRNTESGTVVFICICMKSFDGNPSDTLLLEEQFETHKSNLKFDTFIENSAYDDTNKRVLRDCGSCARNYMTLIRIGEQSKVVYTCPCGARETNLNILGAGKSADSDNIDDIVNSSDDSDGDSSDSSDNDGGDDDSSGITDITGGIIDTVKTHQINMEYALFKYLENNTLKTVTILNKANAGDIVYVYSDMGKLLKLTVLSSVRYMSLRDYVNDIGATATIPYTHTIEEALEVLEKTYDPIKVSKNGIYAITFDMLDSKYMHHVSTVWLKKIASGEKIINLTTVGRLAVGDQLIVYDANTHISIDVCSVRRYKTLAAALKAEEINKILPNITTMVKAKQILGQWITPAVVRKMGVTAIEFKLSN